MAELESLPPDQRAAVQLLLKQGRSYDELAALLDIEPAAVRRRAHDALQSLGPQEGERLGAPEREQVSDYLLGQQPADDRDATRRLLSESPAARAWARSVAGALRPLAPDALPEIPDGRRAGTPAADDEQPSPYAAAPEESPRASRLGGALLLGGGALLVVVVVILLVSGGGDEGDTKGSSVAATTPPSTQTQTTTQATSTRPVAQINLLPPGGGNKPVGLAQVFRRGDQQAIIVAAQGLAPGAYALWLYSSAANARLLGFVPQRVGRDGRFATQGLLPTFAGRYAQLVVTSETVNGRRPRTPTRPGRIVLAGRLSLG